jgi:hypothetical protein
MLGANDDRYAETMQPDGNATVVVHDRERKGDLLIPHGTRQCGHVWLHDGCWERWHDGQVAAAARDYPD